jgi:hypothetical protein
MQRQTNTKVQLWMVLAGLAVTVGFFLPLFEYQGQELLSGWQLLREGDMPARYWLLTAAYPIAGLALLVTAAAGVSIARWVALVVGGLVIVYPTYKLVRLLVEVAGSGAFLMLGGGVAALICGLVGIARKPGAIAAKK